LPSMKNERDYAWNIKDADRNDQQRTKHREYYGCGQTPKSPPTAASSEQGKHRNHNWNH